MSRLVAKKKGMMTCGRQQAPPSKIVTYVKAMALWLPVEEDEAEAEHKASPQDNETRNEPEEGTERCKIAKGFCAKKAGEGRCLENVEDVGLLRVKQVGNLG